ncbi:MAG: helix-turn-helix domain-containing protein [Gammaproteobacteria bacterium]|jgi:transcriptional regulator with XRE-family HTH domain|nr:helix-turn-helix domain-containing protein [Gammaproteobacteria bacterium]
MELAILLGKRIRFLRKTRGISQDRFALACGLDSSYMGRIERGEVNISVVALSKIADALGCTASELLLDLSISKQSEELLQQPLQQRENFNGDS